MCLMLLPKPDMTALEIFVFFGGIQVTVVVAALLILALVSVWHPELLLPRKYESELETVCARTQYVRWKRGLLLLCTILILPLFVICYTFAISWWIYLALAALFAGGVGIVNYCFFKRFMLSF